MRLLLALAALVAISSSALAEPPSRPLRSFDAAKVVARDAIYADRRIDIYCGCAYEPAGRSGGVMDWTACGYQPRKSASRGRQLEWEHVMPAFFFGKDRQCWAEGHADCSSKGRTCCARVDEAFRHAEADLHNLAPSVGEQNADRSNHPFGWVEGEPREYGACNFEVGGDPKRAEPPPAIRGDVARVWSYMAEKTYGVSLTPAQRALLGRWSRDDPADEWELLRDERIEAAQGNRNPFVWP